MNHESTTFIPVSELPMEATLASAASLEEWKREAIASRKTCPLHRQKHQEFFQVQGRSAEYFLSLPNKGKRDRNGAVDSM